MNEDNCFVVAKSKTPDGAVLTEKNITKEYCAMEHRIEQLEQLCRDLYDCYTVGQYKECYECEYYDKRESHCGFTDRMEQLGLLEGGDNE